MWPFTKKAPIEKRAAMSGFTAEIMSARESYISGRRGVAELTGTAQACISLWENSFALAHVTGCDLLNRRSLALAARSLALRGEALFWISDDGLIPCADWDLNTRNGLPRAYRVSISEAGGGYTKTLLAPEVLHFRIGCDIVTPWLGTAPLRRARLTSALLEAVETALADIFETAPLGSQVVPMPELGKAETQAIASSFRGQRGRVMLRESVNVSAAGGPSPSADWRPQDLTPNLERAQALDALDRARNAIALAFGCLPCWFDPAGQGPAIRESQRHLVSYTLQPIASVMAEEAQAKLGTDVAIDLLEPLQAFDAGGRARAFATTINALAQAKTAGLDPSAVANALALIAPTRDALGE